MPIGIHRAWQRMLLCVRGIFNLVNSLGSGNVVRAVTFRKKRIKFTAPLNFVLTKIELESTELLQNLVRSKYQDISIGYRGYGNATP